MSGTSTESVAGAVGGVSVVGVGAVTSLGALEGSGDAGGRGLGRALLDGARGLGPSRSLAAFDPRPSAAEIADLPGADAQAEKLARRLMSRSALLGHLATRAAIADAGWSGPDDVSPDPDACADVGLFMGVGASGGSIEQLEAMLAASVTPPGDTPAGADDAGPAGKPAGAFSLDRFGTRGLRACNPLFAFQLMNNFAMCHAAILAGLRGPNAALFSRGQGTVVALSEAIAALSGGDCPRALAGGADSAVHPVTWAELVRSGHAAEGLVPGEGAAVLALAREPDSRPLAFVERCAYASVRHAGVDAACARAVGARGHDPGPPRDPSPDLAPERSPDLAPDLVVIAAWGPARRDALSRWLRAAAPGATQLDVTAALGDALAATPAIAWAAAVDLIAAGAFARALVVTAGIDGGIGAVVFGSRT